MKRSALKRKPMHRRKPIARPIDRHQSEAWARAARAKPCAVCGRSKDIVGHHLLYQQWLREKAVELGLECERIRWDRRNMLPLCERHHAWHHSAHLRVPRSALRRDAPKVFQFAKELGLEWRLDSVYPDDMAGGN